MAGASGMQRQPQMQSGAVGPISRHFGVLKIGARTSLDVSLHFFGARSRCEVVVFDCAVGRGFPFDEN